MRISLVTPAPPRSRNGNRNTASRWAAWLRELGHEVCIEQHWRRAGADLMIALHARRSHDSIRHYAETHPERPLVVVLTGTDLYRDIKTDRDAQASLAIATRLVVLQELGVSALPRPMRAKTRVIYQSAKAVRAPRPLSSCFEVVVSGHLREEKDPFRTAAAASLLPAASQIVVTHIGRALSAEMTAEARDWMAREPRYRWLGELPHSRALRILGRSRVMVISSRMEGGANVVCEALMAGVPVIASRVDGNVGMLGRHYRGYFPLGDESALGERLLRFERDAVYRNTLHRACSVRAERMTPERERDALQKLLAECVNPRAKAAA